MHADTIKNTITINPQYDDDECRYQIITIIWSSCLFILNFNVYIFFGIFDVRIYTISYMKNCNNSLLSINIAITRPLMVIHRPSVVSKENETLTYHTYQNIHYLLP